LFALRGTGARKVLSFLAQVVNSFGDLSNAELLRRYGFVERRSNLHNAAELSVEELEQICVQWRSQQLQRSRVLPARLASPSAIAQSAAKPGVEELLHGHAGGLHCHADEINPGTGSAPGHACGCAAAQAKGRRAGHKRKAHACPDEGIDRLVFMAEQQLLPEDGWFKISGEPPAELLEAARLLLLPDDKLTAFVKGVLEWRAPLVRPLSAVMPSDIPDGMLEVLTQLCQEHIDMLLQSDRERAKAEMQTPVQWENLIGKGNMESQQLCHPEQMAMVVRYGELHCIRKFLTWLQARTPDDIVQLCCPLWQHLRNTSR
jgi:hypothetical protein